MLLGLGDTCLNNLPNVVMRRLGVELASITSVLISG